MTDLPFVTEIIAEPEQRGSLTISAERLPDSDRQRWRLTLIAGAAGFHGRLRIVLPLTTATVPWFLIPGYFYGQGRTDPRLSTPTLGQLGADRWTAPAWDIALERAAYPVVLAAHGGRWRGLDAEPHYRLSDAPDRPATWGNDEPQIGLGLGWENGRGRVAINLPAFEGPLRQVRHRHDEALARRLTLPAGARIELDVGVWDFAGDGHGYQRVLERLYRELKPQHPSAVEEPHDELAACAAHGLKAWHWTPATGDRPGYFVYTAALDRSVEFNANVNRKTSLGWHFDATGFVGGFPVAFGLAWQGLRQNDAESLAIVDQYVDRLCREAHAPNGLFRTSYHPGRSRTPNGEFANGPDAPGYGSCWQGDAAVAHARTTADASFHLARLIDLLGAAHPRRAAWRAALRRTLDAALRLQQPDGRHPQLYDVVANVPRQLDGCGGLTWIPAMDAAHDCFADEPAFQERLRKSMLAAGASYARDVEAERIYGAPEDVSLSPTSEDGYAAVLAYGSLHRRFGGDDSRWLPLLVRAADWMLTWRKAYNVRFDPRNVLGAGGLRTVGGDFASSNNNHLHVYGMNCLGELHRLTAITGIPYYAERADDHFRFTCQLLCKVDGQWNGQRGMLTEQFYTTDWSIWDGWDPTPAHVQKGTLMGFSHSWCINMVLLGLAELEHRPG